jgi:hypothetical protein
MGAHESNRGLCAALLRMYHALGCMSDETQRCKDIAQRISARHCGHVLSDTGTDPDASDVDTNPEDSPICNVAAAGRAGSE